MQFFLLGRMVARAGSQVVSLGRRQERCLIGLLLLDCNRLVPLERLADLLWDGSPPAKARPAIQTYMSRLRTQLAPHGVRITGGPDGYQIDVDPQDVDIHQLRAGVTLALKEADPERRLALLDRILELCRGPLLADVASPGLRVRIGAEADGLQLTAVELCAEAELALGRPEKAISLAQRSVAGRPVRERLVAVLMEAYRKSGRKSEAIAVYHAARRTLVDDLGLEPEPSLRRLYDEILRDDPKACACSTGTVQGAQLPPAAVPFIGRAREFVDLDRLMMGGPATLPGPRVVVVAGGAGFGKTALVVRWAREHANDFPDGQVLVEMRGFGSGTAATATEAMNRVLLALGVDSNRIPAEPGALQPFYRRMTAERRLIVIFDDVLTADQARAALPTGPHAAALITSRRRLSALTTLGDAAGLDLAPLATDDALELMAQLLPEHGHNRAALTDLAELCACVPLFLRVSAANVRLGGDPASFASAMRSQRVLDYLQSAADPAVGARAALALSYQSLPRPARRLLRAVGRVPARFVTPDSAGAMLGVDPARGRWHLERIADVHLIEQSGFGRYQLHDLVRSFAAEQVVPADDDGAARRLMSFYMQAVHRASAVATANTAATPNEPEPGVPLPVMPDAQAAMAWLDSELSNIVAVVQHAAVHGPHEFAWEISRRLTHYFWIRRSLPEWRAINEAALAAARTADRQDAVASMLNALAVTIWTTNDLDRTRSLFEEALTLNGRLGREAAQGSNHNNLGSLCRQTGQLKAALAHTRAAIQLGGRHDRPLTVANALLNLGSLHRDLGALYEASRTVGQALAGYRTLGSIDGEISSLNVLACVRCELGHLRAAESAAQRSLRMADEFGSVHGAIFAREAMTDVLIAAGRAGDARKLSEAALSSALEQADRRMIIAASLSLAAVLAASDSDDEARLEAERARSLAIEQHDLHGHVDALLIMAQLPDEPRHALSLAGTAEREAARAGLRLREAKAQQIRAELCLAGRDPIAARTVAVQAWPVLRRSGAKLWITRCASILRTAGPAVVAPERVLAALAYGTARQPDSSGRV